MNNQESSHKKPSTISKVINSPIKAMCKVLDLYAKSVTDFSNGYHRPAKRMVIDNTPINRQYRSASTSRLLDTHQTSEGALFRSISASAALTGSNKSQNNIGNLEMHMLRYYRQQMQAICPLMKRLNVPKSCNAGMGKIDEDRALSFRNDDIVIQNKLDLKNKVIGMFIEEEEE